MQCEGGRAVRKAGTFCACTVGALGHRTRQYSTEVLRAPGNKLPA